MLESALSCPWNGYQRNTWGLHRRSGACESPMMSKTRTNPLTEHSEESLIEDSLLYSRTSFNLAVGKGL